MLCPISWRINECSFINYTDNNNNNQTTSSPLTRLYEHCFDYHYGNTSPRCFSNSIRDVFIGIILIPSSEYHPMLQQCRPYRLYAYQNVLVLHVRCTDLHSTLCLWLFYLSVYTGQMHRNNTTYIRYQIIYKCLYPTGSTIEDLDHFSIREYSSKTTEHACHYLRMICYLDLIGRMSSLGCHGRRCLLVVFASPQNSLF